MGETMTNGLFGELSGWFSHPLYSSGNSVDWLWAMAVLLIAAFLWSTVVRSME